MATPAAPTAHLPASGDAATHPAPGALLPGAAAAHAQVRHGRSTQPLHCRYESTTACLSTTAAAFCKQNETRAALCLRVVELPVGACH